MLYNNPPYPLTCDFFHISFGTQLYILTCRKYNLIKICNRKKYTWVKYSLMYIHLATIISFTDVWCSCFPLCCPHKTIVRLSTMISHKKDDYMYHHYTGWWITSHRAGDAHFLFQDTGLACYFVVENLCSMMLIGCYFSIGGSLVLFPHFTLLHSLKLGQHEHW